MRRHKSEQAEAVQAAPRAVPVASRWVSSSAPWQWFLSLTVSERAAAVCCDGAAANLLAHVCEKTASVDGAACALFEWEWVEHQMSLLPPPKKGAGSAKGSSGRSAPSSAALLDEAAPAAATAAAATAAALARAPAAEEETASCSGDGGGGGGPADSAAPGADSLGGGSGEEAEEERLHRAIESGQGLARHAVLFALDPPAPPPRPPARPAQRKGGGGNGRTGGG